MLDEFHNEQRWVVRIYKGHDQVYFKNDLTNDFFRRWQWYFEYRAALIKVQNPKSRIRFEVGAYDFVLPEDSYRVKLKNILIKRKAQVTEFKCKIENARKNWNELFPIEENPHWRKVQDKLNRLEKEYSIALEKQKDLEENGYPQLHQPIRCFNQLVETGH